MSQERYKVGVSCTGRPYMLTNPRSTVGTYPTREEAVRAFQAAERERAENLRAQALQHERSAVACVARAEWAEGLLP